MSMHTLRRREPSFHRVSEALKRFLARRMAELGGIALLGGILALSFAMASWSVADPSFNHATGAPARNLLGLPGAIAADLVLQVMGIGAVASLLPLAVWGGDLIRRGRLPRLPVRFGLWLVGSVLACATASALPPTARWPLPTGLGGVVGDRSLGVARMLVGFGGTAVTALVLAALTILALTASCGLGRTASPKRDAKSNGPETR